MRQWRVRYDSPARFGAQREGLIQWTLEVGYRGMLVFSFGRLGWPGQGQLYHLRASIWSDYVSASSSLMSTRGSEG